MHTDSTQQSIAQRQLVDRKLNHYELAVCFAAAKAQEEEFRWEQFIDNLSYICDKFASHIEVNDPSNLNS